MIPPKSLPVLVLLPGLDGTGKLFGALVNELAGRLDTQVMAYPTDQCLGYDELADLVRAALPPDRPFVLLGESFSGPIAIRLAAETIRGLEGVILSASFARNPFPGLGWARSFAAYLPVKSLPRWMRAPLMWGSLSPSRATSHMERAMTGVSSSVIRHRIAALLAVDETAALERVAAPILVLRAGSDRVIPKGAMRRIMKLAPRAQLVTVNGPHLLLQACPAACADIIIRFTQTLQQM
jgi:pimeloyl-[acyl-carrier protein] methyl ester esterase